MQVGSVAKFLKVALAGVLLGSSLSVGAQPTGLLYDPEPPADSAYVRVMTLGGDGVADILVDGRSRIQKVTPGEPSEFMVLSAGKHSIAVQPAGKPAALLTTTLDVVRGRAMTIVFTSPKSGVAPTVFEDKTNANRLKALLSVYHLDPGVGPLDVSTADGNAKVVTNLTYGTSKSISVNPISVDLVVAKSADKAPLAKTSIAMMQGGTYSILLISDANGKLTARAVQNKVERYTGK